MSGLCSWCGKQELRIKHLGRDAGAIPLQSCKRGRLALGSWRERSEVGSGNCHLLCPGDLLAAGTWSCSHCKGETGMSHLAQTSGSHVAGQGQQGRDRQLPEPGRACIPSLQGRTSCPSPTMSFQQGPVSLCSGNKVFGVCR